MTGGFASAGTLGRVSRLGGDAEVRVRVPASTANLGPGFDSVGMALGVWDEAHVRLGGDRLVIDARGNGAGEVPLDERHLVYRSMRRAWQALGLETPRGLQLTYDCVIPHSRGMGSSASAIVAGVALAASLAGHPLDEAATLAFVSDVASAIEGHPDNASASVHGNATVSWAADGGAAGWRTAVLTPHPDVVPMLVVPLERLSTATARAALPDTVPLATAARNAGRSALLVHALTSAPELLMPATVDYLHQEARRPAYPHSMALVDALRADGIPAVISGAGPTVLALATADTRARVHAFADGGEVIEPGVPATGVHAVSC